MTSTSTTSDYTKCEDRIEKMSGKPSLGICLYVTWAPNMAEQSLFAPIAYKAESKSQQRRIRAVAGAGIAFYREL
ncbi:hypothetical protein E4U13_006076 [Claviceps humidiphila]|uniref:Uncharacterized protein n=1 Tax=Claviceps humidiphila TaxID=1294629 RepID=A0A9P7PUH5_9HYPO|nr:hypothetical protein E4U13_006076 [Claviceps humidiphila]